MFCLLSLNFGRSGFPEQAQMGRRVQTHTLNPSLVSVGRQRVREVRPTLRETLRQNRSCQVVNESQHWPKFLSAERSRRCKPILAWVLQSPSIWAPMESCGLLSRARVLGILDGSHCSTALVHIYVRSSRLCFSRVSPTSSKPMVASFWVSSWASAGAGGEEINTTISVV